MTKKKELRQLYGGGKPKSYRLADNHIMHTNATSHGDRGFRRFWIPPQWIGDGWEKCPCTWHNGDEHYAVKEHVDHWKKQIKKLENLDAVYRDINRRLAAHFRKLWRDMEADRRRASSPLGGSIARGSMGADSR
jgi:hypothetical protein